MVIRVGHEPAGQLRGVVDEPKVSSVEIAFIDWIECGICNRFWVGFNGSPHVCNVPVQIVDGGPPRKFKGSIEPDGTRAEKWLDVVSAIRSESRPDEVGSF